MHRDAEPPSGAGGEGEGSVVCLGDASDNCQTEANARVVGAYALRAALKRLGERRDHLWREGLARVLDGEGGAVRSNACRHPDAPAVGQVVDDRVVHEVRRELEQQRVSADRVCRVARGLDGDAAFLGEREEAFQWLLPPRGKGRRARG